MTHPEVLTLHWAGPEAVEPPPQVSFPQSSKERCEAERELLEAELQEVRRTEQGRTLWEQIRREAERRGGDASLWRRKLHAFWWVKMAAKGNAAEYARLHGVNHATVRTWIAEVVKLAYEVGFRLHEDRLLLVGKAPPGLERLRRRVNEDAASPEAWRELRRVEGEYRGQEGYFHLNEGHVLRAHGRLRESDATLREGLVVAEAPPLRALLWNARGQTWWDCQPGSAWPLPDPTERAEQAFRRAAVLDPTAYFPYVNLAQLAVDAGDLRRAEYWIGELAAARKSMEPEMKDDLARYLDGAEWTGAVVEQRFWRSGPARWLREAARRGVLAIAGLALAGALALLSAPATAAPQDSPAPVSRSGPEEPKRGGAGGN